MEPGAAEPDRPGGVGARHGGTARRVRHGHRPDTRRVLGLGDGGRRHGPEEGGRPGDGGQSDGAAWSTGHSPGPWPKCQHVRNIERAAPRRTPPKGRGPRPDRSPKLPGRPADLMRRAPWSRGTGSRCALRVANHAGMARFLRGSGHGRREGRAQARAMSVKQGWRFSARRVVVVGVRRTVGRAVTRGPTKAMPIRSPHPRGAASDRAWPGAIGRPNPERRRPSRPPGPHRWSSAGWRFGSPRRL